MKEQVFILKYIKIMLKM